MNIVNPWRKKRPLNETTTIEMLEERRMGNITVGQEAHGKESVWHSNTDTWTYFGHCLVLFVVAFYECTSVSDINGFLSHYIRNYQIIFSKRVHVECSVILPRSFKTPFD